MRVLLIDISSIAHPIWHKSGEATDPDHVSNATVRRVRELAADYDHVAVCCDSRRSFRREKCPSYKSDRESKPEALFYQLDRAKRLLRADGYAILEADGYEADDCIATAVKWLVAHPSIPSVTIGTADKDLCQLVGGSVAIYSTTTNELRDSKAVEAKFGVPPSQLRDWLAMVGDKSDNVDGCPGIGPVKATALLKRHGSFAQILAAALGPKVNESIGMTPAMRAAIIDNQAKVALAWELVGLMDNAPIDCSQILQRREPLSLVDEERAAIQAEDIDDEPRTEDHVGLKTIDPEQYPALSATETRAEVNQQTGEVTEVQVQTQVKAEPSGKPATVPQSEFDKLLQQPVQWEKALEPRSPGEAFRMATHMHDSRMFSGYGNPDAVLSTIMLGRELGIGTMGSLRGIHNIKGRHALSADLMVALVLKSGKCEYFEFEELSPTKAVYVTKRVGRPEKRMVFEYSEAERAGLVKGDGNWQKWPTDMCKARCIARLARAVYPDVCFGLYVIEELSGLNETKVAA